MEGLVGIVLLYETQIWDLRNAMLMDREDLQRHDA
jgi:hypothetical protein